MRYARPDPLLANTYSVAFYVDFGVFYTYKCDGGDSHLTQKTDKYWITTKRLNRDGCIHSQYWMYEF